MASSLSDLFGGFKDSLTSVKNNGSASTPSYVPNGSSVGSMSLQKFIPTTMAPSGGSQVGTLAPLGGSRSSQQQDGYGYGYGYGYGSGGSSGGSSSSTSTDTTTQHDTGHTTTVNETLPDFGAIENAAALSREGAQQLDRYVTAQLQGAQDAYDMSLDNLRRSELDARRLSNDSWFLSQQKLQDAVRTNRNAMGQGAYSSTMDAAMRQAERRDDMYDQDILNQLRVNMNGARRDFNQAVNELNQNVSSSMSANRQGLDEMLLKYMADDLEKRGSSTRTDAYTDETTTSTVNSSSTSSWGDGWSSSSVTTDISNDQRGNNHTVAQTNSNSNDFIKDGAVDMDSLREYLGANFSWYTQLPRFDTVDQLDYLRQPNVPASYEVRRAGRGSAGSLSPGERY